MSYIDPLVIFFILYAILAWRSLPTALVLITGILPAYLLRFNIGPLPSTALEGMILIAAARWLYVVYTDRATWKARAKQIRASAFFLPGLALVAASLIACFVAPDLRAALGIWRAYFVEPLLLYIMLIDVCSSRNDRERIINALGLTVLGLTLIAIIQRVTGWWSPTWEWTLPESRRVTSLFTSPNSLGLFVVPVAMLHFAPKLAALKARLPLKAWPKQVWFSSAVGLFAVLSIVLAVSRGAMIAFAAAALFLLYRQYSKRVALIAAVAGIVLLLIIPQARTQMTTLISFQAASGISRINLYRGTLAILKANPVTGTGLAGFATAFERVRPADYTEKLIYPHNIFLNFWTETGILGLLVVLWLMFRVARLSFASADAALARDAVIAALVAMLVHGLVDVPYFKNDLAALTWVLLALLALVIPTRGLYSVRSRGISPVDSDTVLKG